MSIRIRALGHFLGEDTLNAAQLSLRVNVPEAMIRASIGDGVVHVSSEDGIALACRASQVCLQRAGLTPVDVDALVLFDTMPTSPNVSSGLQFQRDLGATRAFALTVGMDCSESVTALSMACDLIRAKHAARVLVASGSAWKQNEGFDRRMIGPVTDKNHRDVFSDGAAAALVEDSANREGIELLGFGFATSGQHADYIKKLVDHQRGLLGDDDLPKDVQIGYDAIQLNALARDRCLRNAGLQASDFDCLLFPQEASGLPKWFAKHLGFSSDRLVYYTDVSHVGSPDPLLGLERLQRTASPGLTVLVAARSYGSMRFVAARF